MTSRVLLLSPSRGLGGGIERYVETMEWAFAAEGVHCQRLDLLGHGTRAHARLLAQGRAILRADSEATRLVVAHRSLLPAAALLARDSTACGVSALYYGSEMWGSRWRPRRELERRLMRGIGVRAVAIRISPRARSSGIASLQSYRQLCCKSSLTLWPQRRQAGQTVVRGFRLATAFRLWQWQTKGLPQLVEAVMALGRPDVRLTICGSGNPPTDLLRLISEYSWCTLRPGLSDDDLARELAAADLFVLATQTRSGRSSVGEGFGLVLIDAQAAGTPLIAPVYGDSREAYVEGVIGVAPADKQQKRWPGPCTTCSRIRPGWPGWAGTPPSGQALHSRRNTTRNSPSGGFCDLWVCPVPRRREVAVLAERCATVMRRARFIREAFAGKRNTPDRRLRGFGHWGAARLLRQPVVSGPVSRVRVSETASLANVLINTAGGCVDIGDYVFFGHDVLLLTGTHDFTVKGPNRQVPRKKPDRGIVIENGAWIASRSVIIGPCRIGANAVIGCGCVVDFDVAADTVVRVRQEVVKDTIRYRGSPRPGQFMGGRRSG